MWNLELLENGGVLGEGIISLELKINNSEYYPLSALFIDSRSKLCLLLLCCLGSEPLSVGPKVVEFVPAFWQLSE